MLRRGAKLVPKIDYVLTFGYRDNYQKYEEAMDYTIFTRLFDFGDEIILTECPQRFLLRNSRKCLSGEITCSECWNTKCSCSLLEYEIIEDLSIRDWTAQDYAERGITTAKEMIDYINKICTERGVKNE